METIANIRLHLVHGTWSKGLLNENSSWVDPDNICYKNLLNNLPKDVELEAFTWSGRNSFRAREIASEKFITHLTTSIKKHPFDCHIILAHSHGGTIALKALSNSKLNNPIRALICLSTPFTDLSRPSRARLQAGLMAIATILYALYWTCICTIFANYINLYKPIVFATIIALKDLFAFVLVTRIALALSKKSKLPHSRESTDVPMILLRGTRDEASMVLSLAQLSDTLCSTFAIHQSTSGINIKKPLTIAGYACSYGICLIAGLKLSITLGNALYPGASTTLIGILGVFVYAPAIAGSIYTIGYSILAFSTGHLDIKSWPFSEIEVESEPLNKLCQMYTFSNLEVPNFRHGIYNDHKVLKKVGEIVKAIRLKQFQH